MSSYPQRLEKYASKLVATLELPEPNSGKILFRLVRLPCQGIETVVDILDFNNRYLLRISRILISLRTNLQNSINLRNSVPVEISCGYIDKISIADCMMNFLREQTLQSDLEDCEESDHFFAFYTDSVNCYASGITNPHKKSWAELWQIIINRTYGLDHLVGRRHLRTDNLLLDSSIYE